MRIQLLCTHGKGLFVFSYCFHDILYSKLMVLRNHVGQIFEKCTIGHFEPFLDYKDHSVVNKAYLNISFESDYAEHPRLSEDI